MKPTFSLPQLLPHTSTLIPRIKVLHVPNIFSQFKLFSCVQLCDPMDCSMPGFPVHHQLPELAQIRVHQDGDAIQLSHPLSSPSPPPSIRVFSSESVLRIKWPKYWSFSFSISPSNEYSGLISFRIEWSDLLAVQGTLRSLLQHHSINYLAFILLYGPTVTSIYDYWKNHSFDYMNFCQQMMSLLFNTLSRFVSHNVPSKEQAS